MHFINSSDQEPLKDENGNIVEENNEVIYKEYTFEEMQQLGRLPPGYSIFLSSSTEKEKQT